MAINAPFPSPNIWGKQWYKLYSKYVVVFKLRKARELISIYHTHSSSSILTASIRKNKKMEIICLALSWKTCS